MPTYLCHGFRWQRPLVRMYVAAHRVEDAAPDWLARPGAAQGLAASLRGVFHFLGDDEILFLEEYRLSDDAAARPYAYVADAAVRVDLSAPVADVLARYDAEAADQRRRRQQRHKTSRRANTNSPPLPAMTGPRADEGAAEAPPLAVAAATQVLAATLRPGGVAGDGRGGWLEQLRDGLQPGAPIRWYVVVNEDEERGWGEEEDNDEEEEKDDDNDQKARRLQLRRDLGDPDVEGTGADETDETDGTASDIRSSTTVPPLPPPPADPPARPPPPLRPRKSLDLRAGGLRRLFGRRESDGRDRV